MDKSHTIEFFDERAEKWDDAHTPASPKRLKQVVDLAELKEGDSVLDVGCGTGVLIPTLKNALGHNGHILALDPSTGMLSVLMKKYGNESISTMNEMLEECTAPETTFDAIICFSCFSPYCKQSARHCQFLSHAKNGW